MSRAAIISGGAVVNVVVVEPGDEAAFGVAVPAGLPVAAGWFYQDGAFTAPAAPPAPEPPAPAAISRVQLELWLDQHGFADGLENASVLATIAAAANATSLEIKRRSAQTFSRTDPDIIALAAALNIDLDTAFVEAAAL